MPHVAPALVLDSAVRWLTADLMADTKAVCGGNSASHVHRQSRVVPALTPTDNFREKLTHKVNTKVAG